MCNRLHKKYESLTKFDMHDQEKLSKYNNSCSNQQVRQKKLKTNPNIARHTSLPWHSNLKHNIVDNFLYHQFSTIISEIMNILKKHT